MLGAARLGALPLYNCTTSTGSGYRPCALSDDGGRYTLLLVNDGIVDATRGSAMPQGLALRFDLSAAASQCQKIRQLTVAPLIAETIQRIAKGESVMSLFSDQENLF